MVQNSLFLVVKEMHHSFENLVVTGVLCLQASLIDIHDDASFRSILEIDSSSSTSKTCIYFCLGKGAKLWLIARPSIRSFYIAHSTITSMLHFHFSLIQPLASNVFMCEYGHSLNAFNTYLT